MRISRRLCRVPLSPSQRPFSELEKNLTRCQHSVARQKILYRYIYYLVTVRPPTK